MALTRELFKGRRELTMEQFQNLISHDANMDYNLMDHPDSVFATSNEVMTAILGYDKIFPLNTIVICNDDGTYIKGKLYQIQDIDDTRQWVQLSKDMSEYVKFTDYATVDNNGGIVKLKDDFGIRHATDGYIYTVPAYDIDVESQSSANYRTLQPRHISNIVKVGLTKNNLTWSETEKAAARDLIGAIDSSSLSGNISSLENDAGYITKTTAVNHVETFYTTAYSAETPLSYPSMYSYDNTIGALKDITRNRLGSVAIGDNGLVAFMNHSSTNWEISTPFTDANLISITCNTDLFVCVDANGKLYKSATGTTWEEIEVNTNGKLIEKIEYTNNRFILIGTGLVAYTYDLKNLVFANIDDTIKFNFVKFADDRYRAFADTKLYYSTNGIDWHIGGVHYAIANNVYNDGIFKKDRLIIVGNNESNAAICWINGIANCSDNGFNIDTTAYVKLHNLVESSGLIYTIGDKADNTSDILYSVNGLNWYNFYSADFALNSIAIWDGYIIAVGDGDKYCRGSAYINWVDTEPDVSTDATKFVWKKQVVYLDDGTIVSSELEPCININALNTRLNNEIPEAYLKSATVSENILTLRDKDDNIVQFIGGGGQSAGAMHAITAVANVSDNKILCAIDYTDPETSEVVEQDISPNIFTKFIIDISSITNIEEDTTAYPIYFTYGGTELPIMKAKNFPIYGNACVLTHATFFDIATFDASMSLVFAYGYITPENNVNIIIGGAQGGSSGGTSSVFASATYDESTNKLSITRDEGYSVVFESGATYDVCVQLPDKDIVIPDDAEVEFTDMWMTAPDFWSNKHSFQKFGDFAGCPIYYDEVEAYKNFRFQCYYTELSYDGQSIGWFVPIITDGSVFAKKEDVPTKVSDLTNDANYIDNSVLTNYHTKEELVQILSKYALATGNILINPVVVPEGEPNTNDDICNAAEKPLDNDGNTYFLELIPGQTYQVVYEVDGITYNKTAVARQMEGYDTVVLGGSEDREFAYTTQDGTMEGTITIWDKLSIYGSEPMTIVMVSAYEPGVTYTNATMRTPVVTIQSISIPAELQTALFSKQSHGSYADYGILTSINGQPMIVSVTANCDVNSFEELLNHESDFTNMVGILPMNGGLVVQSVTTDDSGAVILTPNGISLMTGEEHFESIATETYVNEHGGKIDKITKNGTELTITNKTVNIEVPVTAADVNALPNTTKYAANISLYQNTSDVADHIYRIKLKDQDGNDLGTEQTFNLPLESVVVGGSYDKSSKKVILTLQNGDTISFSVADLVTGLQPTITTSNKLSVDLVDGISAIGKSNKLSDATDDSTHRLITDAERTAWNAKLDSFTESDPTVPAHVKNITEANITSWNSKLDSYTETDPTVPSHVKSITTTNISSWNNKVDKVDGKGLSTNDFTNDLKTKLENVTVNAEVNVQSDWNTTDTTSDAFIKNKPTNLVTTDTEQSITGTKTFNTVYTNNIGKSSTNYLDISSVLKNNYIGSCDTDAATATKVVTCSGFALEVGCIINVKFINDLNVAAPTLNVNNTGAKAIRYNTSGTTYSAPTASTSVNNGGWAAGDIVRFVYNGTYWLELANLTQGVVYNKPNYAASSGNATTANTIKTIESTANANYYLTFVDANNATSTSENLYTNANIAYNPSTNKLLIANNEVANKNDLSNYSPIDHSHNYSYYQKDIVDLSDTSIYDENMYYPCTSKIPVNGLYKLQVAVQLNSGTKPSWSTHDSGFTYNLSALLKANDWGVTNGTMIVLEDVYAHSSIKPGALTQLTNSGNAVLWLRGGGKYFVFKDWSDSWTAYTETTDIFSQTVAPTETLPTSADATLIEAISTEWCI